MGRRWWRFIALRCASHYRLGRRFDALASVQAFINPISLGFPDFADTLRDINELIRGFRALAVGASSFKLFIHWSDYTRRRSLTGPTRLFRHFVSNPECLYGRTIIIGIFDDVPETVRATFRIGMSRDQFPIRTRFFQLLAYFWLSRLFLRSWSGRRGRGGTRLALGSRSRHPDIFRSPFSFSFFASQFDIRERIWLFEIFGFFGGQLDLLKNCIDTLVNLLLLVRSDRPLLFDLFVDDFL